MKTIILIDGQNLFYGLKEMRILENQIKWDLFFKSLLSSNDELIRTYWFRPQKIHDRFHTPFNIRNQIAYRSFNIQGYNHLLDIKKHPSTTVAKIEEESKKVEEWIKKEKDRFAKIEYNYDQIALEFGDIELIKTGMVKINPYTEEYVGEKGVDISLAVKMIALSVEKKCDKIILISGDFDYAEAVKYSKNNMTKIHIVKLHKGVPPQNRSMSRELAVLADKVIDVYESEIRSNFFKTNSP